MHSFLAAAFPLGLLWVIFTLIATALFLASAYLVFERRGRRRLLPAAGVTLGFAWWLAVIAVWTDWHDADGWGDCYPSCDPVHYATGGILTYGVVAIVLVVVSLVLTEAAHGRRLHSRR